MPRRMASESMKILFLQNIWREYFGVMHLSAALRAAGHEVENRVEPTVAGALRAVAQTDPHLVGFSFTHCEQAYVLAVGAAIKRVAPSIITIAGGSHPTLHPELALREGIDIVCRGEGEQAMLDVVNHVAAGTSLADVPNLALKQNGGLNINPVRSLIEDLDRLPHPWRDGYYRYRFLRDNPVRFFFTSRGCPWNCTFCFNHAFRDLYPNKKHYVRHYSPERVMEEIREVARRWPMRIVRFEDDVFTLDKQRLAQFLALYVKEIRRPYICYIRAGESEETIRLLADTGCITVLFGIETGDQQRRNTLLKKGVTDEQIIHTAELLHRKKIHFFTTNILALPGETWDDALATVRLNQRIKAPDVWCSIFQPYAGLPITEQAISEGLLDGLHDEAIGFNTFANNALKNPDGPRIFNLHKFFYPLVRWPWLEKIILPLTKLKPNVLFHYVWVFFYVYSYRQHAQVTWRRIAVEGAHWFRQFLSTMGARR